MSDARERLEKIRDQLTDAATLCAASPAMINMLPQVTGQLAKVLAQLDALPGVSPAGLVEGSVLDFQARRKAKTDRGTTSASGASTERKAVKRGS